jgi:hypothetical protein
MEIGSELASGEPVGMDITGMGAIRGEESFLALDLIRFE